MKIKTPIKMRMNLIITVNSMMRSNHLTKMGKDKKKIETLLVSSHLDDLSLPDLLPVIIMV